MRIGIFGGSFNPIHIGHIKIAQEAIKDLNLDKLIIVPVNKNPFKKDKVIVSAEHRINMINLVLEDKMELSTFEIERKGISYTIDTVEFFSQKYLNDELYLIIGSDNLDKLYKWKNIDKIAKLVKIVILKRNKKINNINIKKHNCILLNNPIYELSSTKFLNGFYDSVEKKVLEYIGKNKLYMEDILKNTLSQKRFLHSINAKNFAIQLAKSLNYDVQKASFAAFVHDIAKEINEEDSRKIIKKFSPSKVNIEKYKLHQEVGYIILKHYFNIEEEVAHSIRVHTSLDFNLSLLDKIVFMADKLCVGRKWEGIQKIRTLALTHFDEAFNFVVERTKEFNLNKGIISSHQMKIYQKWTKKT